MHSKGKFSNFLNTFLQDGILWKGSRGLKKSWGRTPSKTISVMGTQKFLRKRRRWYQLAKGNIAKKFGAKKHCKYVVIGL